MLYSLSWVICKENSIFFWFKIFSYDFSIYIKIKCTMQWGLETVPIMFPVRKQVAISLEGENCYLNSFVSLIMQNTSTKHHFKTSIENMIIKGVKDITISLSLLLHPHNNLRCLFLPALRMEMDTWSKQMNNQKKEKRTMFLWPWFPFKV